MKRGEALIPDRDHARSVLLLAALLASGCQAPIESDLSEAQANEILVALHAHGIGADKDRAEGSDDGFEVWVAADDVSTALSVLRATEVPRRHEPGLSEVFGEGSLVPTATEERARYAAALGGELARSVERIDGVLDARVHVAIPDARHFALDEARPRPRASVLIRHRPGEAPFEEDAIRALVAGAVDGMEAADVAVVSVAAPPPPAAAPNLVNVGPIAVTRGSASALKGVLGGAIGLNLLLALCLIGVVLRRRRATPPSPDDSP